jgi:hypothetical protein
MRCLKYLSLLLRDFETREKKTKKPEEEEEEEEEDQRAFLSLFLSFSLSFEYYYSRRYWISFRFKSNNNDGGQKKF